MKRIAVIAGVGPGTGAALAHKFAKEGCKVALIARSGDYLYQLAGEIRSAGGEAFVAPTDISDPQQVAIRFAELRSELGPVDILIQHASGSLGAGLMETTFEDFEKSWRVAVLGAFLCARESVHDMLTKKSGSIIFTGATSSVRGRAGSVAFSSSKFAIRGLAWSIARELWPKGIHVAHVIIDGVIDTPHVRKHYQLKPDDPLLKPTAIAEAYWNLVQQDRSAWTFELDLRPEGEDFFG